MDNFSKYSGKSNDATRREQFSNDLPDSGSSAYNRPAADHKSLDLLTFFCYFLQVILYLVCVTHHVRISYMVVFFIVFGILLLRAKANNDPASLAGLYRYTIVFLILAILAILCFFPYYGVLSAEHWNRRALFR